MRNAECGVRMEGVERMNESAKQSQFVGGSSLKFQVSSRKARRRVIRLHTSGFTPRTSGRNALRRHYERDCPAKQGQFGSGSACKTKPIVGGSPCGSPGYIMQNKANSRGTGSMEQPTDDRGPIAQNKANLGWKTRAGRPRHERLTASLRTR